MKALLLKEYKQLVVTEMPQPEFGAADLLIQIKSCGICGSDVHGYDGSSGRRIPPIVMGHEASGVVAAVGKEVRHFAINDRVTFDSTVYCGTCCFCRAGKINLCNNRRVLGVSCGDYRQHGAFAEYVVIPERIAYQLPGNLSFDHAAMVEPISIAVHAVNRTPIGLGDTAVVVGTGMIGLLVLQSLRLAGCGKIIAVDVEPHKLEMAQKLGADIVLNPEKINVVQAIQELTQGIGADVAVECVGAAAPITTAISSLKKGGSLTLVGNITPKIELPLQAVVTRELNVLGSCASNGEYPACLDLLARGAIQVDPLISARISLDEAPMWFERLYAREPGLMKVIVNP